MTNNEKRTINVYLYLYLYLYMQASFMDVRVFHPNAPSYLKMTISNLYKKHTNEKKQAYMRRVQEVEQGSFTPLVFSTSGGFAEEVAKVLERAARKIVHKHKECYSETMTFIKEKTRFSLLRSTLVALRGTKRRVIPVRVEDVDFGVSR